MSNSEDYFLRTPRLKFRSWAEDDFPLAWALWGDPRVAEFLGGPYTEQQVQARLSNEIAMLREHRVQYWPVFALDDGELAGCAGLRPYQSVLELGFHFRPAYWGKGLAQEAAGAVIDHAFQTLRVKSLFAGHHPENRASQRVLQKLGFRFTHQEIYAPTGLLNPAYRLVNPDVSGSKALP